MSRFHREGRGVIASLDSNKYDLSRVMGELSSTVLRGGERGDSQTLPAHEIFGIYNQTQITLKQ